MQLLFQSEVLTIADTACAIEQRACGLEGLEEHHRLVFTRAGAAMSRPADAIAPSVFADPTHVLLLSAGERYRVRHSSRLPHKCTTLAFAAPALSTGDEKIFQVVSRTASPGTGYPIGPDLVLRYHRLRCTLLPQLTAVPALSSPSVEEAALALLHDTLTSPVAMPTPIAEVAPVSETVEVENGCAEGQSSATTLTRRRRRELAESVKMLLAMAPESPHTLSDLAETLGVSTSHLSHVFRAEVGLSPHQYLLQIRLALALEQLSGGATDLSRLAVDLGFATHSHFSAAFRHRFGMPPRCARKLLGLPRSHGAPLQYSRRTAV